MAMTMGQLASEFAKASQNVKPNTDRTLRQVAQVGVGLVKKHIKEWNAIDLGTMWNSTQAERRGSSTYLIGPTVDYAPYVALGTSKMAARPFHETAAKDLGKVIKNMGFEKDVDI